MLRARIGNLLVGDDRSRYLIVVIYPTVEDMRAAGTAYRRDEDCTDALAMFQPHGVYSSYDRHRRTWVDTTGSFIGVMRLCEGALSSEIVSHESVHAAMHIMRMHNWSSSCATISKPGKRFIASWRLDYGESCDNDEESLAYMVGSIVQEVTQLVSMVR